jgi:hypothetical protein
MAAMTEKLIVDAVAALNDAADRVDRLAVEARAVEAGRRRRNLILLASVVTCIAIWRMRTWF